MDVAKLKPITIIGCGPGGPDCMTVGALQAVRVVEVLAGSQHLLTLHAKPNQMLIPIMADVDKGLASINAALKKGLRVGVLVSGDPGLCSLAAPVLRRFGREICHVMPGISSVQFAFARLGLNWLDVRILSAHHDLPDLGPEELRQAKTIAILCGHGASQQWVSDLFAGLGEGRRLTVCQDLSLPTERINEVDGEMFSKMELSSRTIVVIKSSSRKEV